MKRPLFIRSLTEAERQALAQGLGSRDALTLRRCQIILASAEGQRASEIAYHLCCAAQTVRNTIHAFEQQGLACEHKPNLPDRKRCNQYLTRSNGSS
jgi:transposase